MKQYDAILRVFLMFKIYHVPVSKQ